MNTATETVTVTVTQEHIDRGIASSCRSCPVALAFVAAMPDIREAVVMEFIDVADATLYYDEDRWIKASLPENAAAFVRNFDGRRTVVPFTFTAEVTR